jgi:hypothetical protein
MWYGVRGHGEEEPFSLWFCPVRKLMLSAGPLFTPRFSWGAILVKLGSSPSSSSGNCRSNGRCRGASRRSPKAISHALANTRPRLQMSPGSKRLPHNQPRPRQARPGSALCHVKRDLTGQKVRTHRSEKIDHLCVFGKEGFVLDPTRYHCDVLRFDGSLLTANP